MARDGDNQSVTIARLAEACGCGPRTLAALYRRATGQTLREFIAGARIERAKALLMSEGAMVKQVAYLSGFQTPAAFCAAFREATGYTPLQFRALNSAVAH
jgi:AraC family transcriptional regulator